jgi:beta-galactosidase
MRPPPAKTRTVDIHREGLLLRDKSEIVPLWAGAMHYWRHAVEQWAPCLDAMKAMNLRVVDTYIPWGVHEVSKGHFDFGERGSEAARSAAEQESNARLDVARFIQMAGERGLYVIARPGPHINAELTFFGLPERVVWDEDCQARSPKGNPVVLPIVPVAFPVPSYASDAFHDQTALWFDAVGRVLAPLQ